MSRPQSLNCTQATKDALLAGNYLSWDGYALALAPFTTDASVASGSSRQVCEMYLSNNSTATSLETNTWAKVAGTWSSGLTKGTQLTCDSTGKITYSGTATAIVWISSSFSVQPVASGGDRELHIAVYKNGTKVDSTELAFNGRATYIESGQLQGFISVAQNDYLELYIKNVDSDVDATMSYSNCLCLLTALA